MEKVKIIAICAVILAMFIKVPQMGSAIISSCKGTIQDVQKSTESMKDTPILIPHK